MTWTLPERASLSWRQWGAEEIVVYNRGSGGTHLLDAFSAAVLRGIAEGPREFAALARELAERSGAEEGMVRSRLAEVLDLLRQEPVWLASEYASLDSRLADLYEMYETQVDELERNPPGADWNGVFVAQD